MLGVVLACAFGAGVSAKLRGEQWDSAVRRYGISVPIASWRAIAYFDPSNSEKRRLKSSGVIAWGSLVLILVAGVLCTSQCHHSKLSSTLLLTDPNVSIRTGMATLGVLPFIIASGVHPSPIGALGQVYLEQFHQWVSIIFVRPR